MLGEAYFKLDNLSEAEHWYREALRVKPDHVPAHLTFGKLLAKMVSDRNSHSPACLARCLSGAWAVKRLVAAAPSRRRAAFPALPPTATPRVRVVTRRP